METHRSAGSDGRATEPPGPSPCRGHGCSACCLATQMSLTRADVARLARAGKRGFFIEDSDGYWRLRNSRGRCVLLTESGCGAYDDRPEGCVLYPLIFMEGPLSGEGSASPGEVAFSDSSGASGIDPFCPYWREFTFSHRDHAWLCRSVAVEEAEARTRLERRSSS